MNLARQCGVRLNPHVMAATAMALLGIMVTACSSHSIKLEELAVTGKEATGQSREYAGVSVNQATEAAQKVLRLAGYSVFPTPDGLIAALKTFSVLPPTAFWTVTAAMRQNGVRVHVDLRTCYGGTAYSPTAPAYRLFFERLDYLLQVQPKWITCTEAVAKWPGKNPKTSVHALCFQTRSHGFFSREKLVEPDPDKLLPNTTPTTSEWLNLTTRRYADITPDQVLNAAKKALTRSQSAFEYRDIPGGFVARVTKYHVFFAVIAAGDSFDTHFWEVHAKEVPGGSSASVYVTTETDSWGAVGAGIGATVGGGHHQMPGLPSLPRMGQGVYGLFWVRLEHILGLVPHWTTCAEAREKGWLAMPDPICFKP